MVDLLHKVTEFIKNKGLVRNGGHILVALSGGADSVCLLSMLIEAGYEVEAAHCNFHLRGEESNRDEKFVRDLCQKWNVAVHVKDFETEKYASEKGISIEMAARELRYEWFEELRQERKCQSIAVAHHRDDNIETLILNLVRGTGIRGLKGMMPQNGHVIRPLLCISRKDVLDYLNQKGQDYVTDRTNLETIYNRNKVRLEILPLLKSINPSAEENIERTIENLVETDKVYEFSIAQQADEYTAEADGTTYIDICGIKNSPSPLSLLFEILSKKDFNRSQVELILKEKKSGKQFLSTTHRLIVDRMDYIVEPIPKNDGQVIPIEEFPSISIEKKNAEEVEFDKNPKFAYLDAKKIVGKLMVRHIQKGDFFYPYGMKGKKLVSDFLTDKKLSLQEKERQKVVTDDNGIVWIVGLRGSEHHKVDFKTKDVLILKVE